MEFVQVLPEHVKHWHTKCNLYNSFTMYNSSGATAVKSAHLMETLQKKLILFLKLISKDIFYQKNYQVPQNNFNFFFKLKILRTIILVVS